MQIRQLVNINNFKQILKCVIFLVCVYFTLCYLLLMWNFNSVILLRIIFSCVILLCNPAKCETSNGQYFKQNIMYHLKKNVCKIKREFYAHTSIIFCKRTKLIAWAKWFYVINFKIWVFIGQQSQFNLMYFNYFFNLECSRFKIWFFYVCNQSSVNASLVFLYSISDRQDI